MKFFPLLAVLPLLAASLALAQSQVSPAATKAIAGATNQNLGVALTSVVQCPATIDVAATNASPPWLANSVRLNVDTVTLTNQPIETQQMVCRYKGSGYEWAVMQPIRPMYKSCVANGKSSFKCTKP
jgi:hypothetical protein